MFFMVASLAQIASETVKYPDECRYKNHQVPSRNEHNTEPTMHNFGNVLLLNNWIVDKMDNAKLFQHL